MKVPLDLFMYCFLYSSAFLLLCVLLTPGFDLVGTDTGDQRDAVYRVRSGEDLISGTWPSLERPIRQGCPMIPKPLLPYVPLNHSDPLTDREKVLAMCKQTAPISLDSFFTETMKRTVTKIADGAFTDVYGCQKEGWDRLAIKILPIEGSFKYNHAMQNTLESIQPEIVVSIEMSMLGAESRKSNKSVLHYTKNFMQIDRITLCAGKFPKFLMDAWDDFDFREKPKSDRPDVFPSHQLYILFSAEYSGPTLHSYIYHSFEEFISIMQQVSISLAVAEETLQFEHRDMHRGNVLVRRTHEEYIYFRLDGVEYSIKSHGVKATIVDYTFSRITQESTNCTSYADPDIIGWHFNEHSSGLKSQTYKAMADLIRSNPKGFYPRSNVLWLHYMASRVHDTDGHGLKNVPVKVWERYISHILENQAAKGAFLNVFSPEAVKKLTRLSTLS